MKGSASARVVWLVVLGLAVGWFESSVVVYLRELYYPDGFRFPIVLAPARIAVVEIIRELASLVLLGAAARLAGRFLVERLAAFMLLFGVWDLSYYAFLWLVLGWPESLATWDVLFLVPLPWVGPVWAPCAVSVALVAVGALWLSTPERPRRLAPADFAAGAAAALLVAGSMMWQWRVVLERGVPRSFPAAALWAGLVLGLARLCVIERRAARARE